jgi:hypothetical protein
LQPGGARGARATARQETVMGAFLGVGALRRGAGAAVLVVAGPLTLSATARDLPPPKTDVVPPVELTVAADGKTVSCAPAELRLPAQTNVHVRLVNQTDKEITITAPQIFDKNVLRHDGDLVHVASAAGYTLKPEGHGDIELRTLAPGQYPYGCTSAQNQGAPFKGTLVFVPPT